MSSSYHARPWRAEIGWAWWLLCQPSPKLSSATNQLLRESSRVAKRREPHMCVIELTIQVTCWPTVTRRKMPHSTNGMPPKASSKSPTMRQRDPVITVQPDDRRDPCTGRARNARQSGYRRCVAIAHQHPQDVRPPAAVARRVRVAVADRRTGDACGASPPRRSARPPAPACRKPPGSIRASAAPCRRGGSAGGGSPCRCPGSARASTAPAP